MAEKKITSLSQLQMLAQRSKDELKALDTKLQETIKAQVASVYRVGGSVTFDSLPKLEQGNVGTVVNVTDSFTTTGNFVEGAGKQYPGGTNVVVVETGSGSYQYDAMSGFVDLSGYVQQEAGKGLSSEDFTAALKSKLEELNVAENNEVESMLNEVFGAVE